MWKDLPWPSLRYCSHINMEGLREMMKNTSWIIVFVPWFEPGTSGLRSRNVIYSTTTFRGGIQCWFPSLLRAERMYAELLICIRVKRIGPVIREALVYRSKPEPSVSHGNTAAVLYPTYVYHCLGIRLIPGPSFYHTPLLFPLFSLALV